MQELLEDDEHEFYYYPKNKSDWTGKDVAYICEVDALEKAKENIKLAGFENNITILEGDAEELLKEVEGPFDMIFMDAAKGQYKLFYDMVIDKLKVDGLLISDNILYKGMVTHDDFVIRRKKTIVKRMSR